MDFQLASDFTSYDQVPVYRRRWFFGMCIAAFIPGALVLALTGEIYLSKGGQVMKYPRGQRIMIAVVGALVIGSGIMRALA